MAGGWHTVPTKQGEWEMNVQPFMRPGGRVRVSISGGSRPRWRADGKELFYLTLDGADGCRLTRAIRRIRVLPASCSTRGFG